MILVLFRFLDGVLISLFSIFIVFLLLIILMLLLYSFRFIKEPKDPKNVVIPLEKKFTINDIKDKDMMVAALVASIEYRNHVKEDVFIKSIKEIQTKTEGK